MDLWMIISSLSDSLDLRGNSLELGRKSRDGQQLMRARIRGSFDGKKIPLNIR
jgi:hypothetical protein